LAVEVRASHANLAPALAGLRQTAPPKIRDALDAAGFVVEASDRIWIPEDRVEAPAPHAALDALDALDDTTAVWHNASS